MRNLLLIDSRIKESNIVTQSLTSDSLFVIFDYFNDSLQDIINKITSLNVSTFDSVGIFQENYFLSEYQFVQSFETSFLENVENIDPMLLSWKSYELFISYLVNELQINNIDLLSCNTLNNSNWTYVINYFKNKYNITIEYSTDNTGSALEKGNFILESNNTNLIEKYFTDNILNYPYILGNWSSESNYLLTTELKVFSCGLNNLGQLGIGSLTNQSYLNQMKLDANTYITNVKQVAIGFKYVVVLTISGIVYSCGLNNFGQLGIGSLTNQSYLTQMKTDANTYITDVRQVVIGENNVFLLKNSGIAYSCGNNNFGQLGIGNFNNQSYLTQMKSDANTYITNVKQITTSAFNVFTLINSGSVFSCGYNSNGQLGIGNTNIQSYLTQMKSDANTYITNVKQITASLYSSTILINSGNVYSCGLNNFGQLGIGNTNNQSYLTQMKTNAITYITDVKQITSTIDNPILLTNSGNVYSCGVNNYGQLGIGNTNNQSYLTQMKSDANTYITNVKQITANDNNVFILTSDKIGYSCGRNDFGQLGLGTVGLTQVYLNQMKTNATTYISDIKQISSSYYFSYILTNSGNVYACGYNNYGQLGNGNFSGFGSNPFLQPMKINANTSITNVLNINSPDSLLNFLYPTVSSAIASNIYNYYDICNGGYTLVELKTNNIPLIYLITAFSATEILNSGYTLTDLVDSGSNPTYLKAAGYNVSDLKSAGYSLTQLKSLGYTATELKAVGYSLTEFKTTLFTATELKTAGYFLTELKTVGYTLTELKPAFTVTELKTSGYTLAELKSVLFTATELKSTGYSLTELKTVGYSLTELKAALFTATELKTSGYSITELKSVLFTATELKATGYSLTELKTVGYSPTELKAAGFSLTELKTSGYSLAELKTLYTTTDLKAAGFTLAEFKNAGYTASELYIRTIRFWYRDNASDGWNNGSYTLQETNTNIIVTTLTGPPDRTDKWLYTDITIKPGENYKFTKVNGNYPDENLYAVTNTFTSIYLGTTTTININDINCIISQTTLPLTSIVFPNIYSLNELIVGSFTASELKAGGISLAELKNAGFSLTELKATGYSLAELKTSGYSLAELKAVLFTATELKATGYSLTELKDAGFFLTELKPAFTATELKASGYSLAELKDAGFSLTELKPAFTATELKTSGYSLAELKAVLFTATELKASGYTLAELKDAGFSLTELKPAFTATELKASGYSLAELKDAGFSLTELKTLFTTTNLKTAGFTLAEFKNAGYTASELHIRKYRLWYKDTGNDGWNNGSYTLQEINTNIIVTTLTGPPSGTMKWFYIDITIKPGENYKFTKVNGNYPNEMYYAITNTFTSIYLGTTTTININDINCIISQRFSGLSSFVFPDIFSLDELKPLFNLSELKAAAFTATDLKAAAFTATELKTAFTPSELKAALFTATELKAALFTPSELKAAAFTASELKAALFTATELKAALFTPSELKAAAFTASELKAALFTATDLKAALFTPSELKTVGYTLTELKAALFTPSELKTALFTATELKPLFNLSELKAAAFTPSELKDAGFSLTELKTSGYSASELFSIGQQLIRLWYRDTFGDTWNDGSITLKEINTNLIVTTLTGPPFGTDKWYYIDITINTGENYIITKVDGGYGWEIFYAVTNTLTSIYLATTTTIDLNDINCIIAERTAPINLIVFPNIYSLAAFSATELKTAFTPSELKTLFTPSELKAAAFTATELKTAFTPSELKTAFTPSELKAALFTPSELKAALFTATELKPLFNLSELKAAAFTATELKAAAFTATELKAAAFTATELKAASFTATELKATAFTPSELKAAAFTATELKAALFTATDLKAALFTATDLKAALFTATDLKAALFTLSELKPAFTATELKAALFTLNEFIVNGFTSTELISALFNAIDFITSEVTASQLLTIGFTAVQLKTLFTPNQLFSTTIGFSRSEILSFQFNIDKLKSDIQITAYELESSGYYLFQDINENFENIRVTDTIELEFAITQSNFTTVALSNDIIIDKPKQIFQSDKLKKLQNTNTNNILIRLT
jgi:intracellular multiplication protein IcmE